MMSYECTSLTPLSSRRQVPRMFSHFAASCGCRRAWIEASQMLLSSITACCDCSVWRWLRAVRYHARQFVFDDKTCSELSAAMCAPYRQPPVTMATDCHLSVNLPLPATEITTERRDIVKCVIWRLSVVDAIADFWMWKFNDYYLLLIRYLFSPIRFTEFTEATRANDDTDGISRYRLSPYRLLPTLYY